MKCEVIISKDCEEKVLIYARERTRLIDEIEQMINSENCTIFGKNDNAAAVLNPQDIYYFITSGNKVCAILENESFSVKYRLYQLEQMLPADFIKINQSCIANIKAIERFDFSIWGAIKVIFKNGESEFVSRRNIKNIKERLGL